MLSVRIERVACSITKPLRGRLKGLNELGVDTFLHKNAGAGNANLAYTPYKSEYYQITWGHSDPYYNYGVEY